MENKIIKNTTDNLEIKKHPDIKSLQIINGKNNFPISMLNKQGYCEYSIYLEHIKKIKVGPTSAMLRGSYVHQELEDEFLKTATPTTFEEALDNSKSEAILSREMGVISPEYGIRGFIDEVQMTPDEFVIIDDKPGTTPYDSTINQVRAYCLAFKQMVKGDKRPIKGALRERGTDNIFFIEEFDTSNENRIKFLLDRMEGLFNETKPFVPTKNKNKCLKCRYQSYCDHF
ncbi:PD-(D/E)XK nuclease family protein [Methanobrevibacter sp. DSM 116169]|uniref:CRISPR-associated protein Cas4 n=1 Tax=Methanobrevibacter sp. DSM 116169 TaxID=3242727 RepID=UPI0038FCCCD5